MTTGRVRPGAAIAERESRALLLAAALFLPVLAVATPGAREPARGFELREGAIVRGPVDRKQIALVFTGHEFAEGGDAILDALGVRNVKASFFLTGVFLRNEAFAPLVHRMVREGHYVGAHSDDHLLYCPWEGPKVTLVTREQFESDLRRNYERLERFGVTRDRAPLYLPPYEWYNEEIAGWTRDLGLTLICHTRGTRSNADYTEEGTPQFVSSQAIWDSILSREQEDPHGLNGFILLLHVGAGPKRADKFHPRVGALVDTLRERGYTFVRVDDLLR